MASILTVGSAVLDRVYTLTNLPERDGGAFATDSLERAGGVAANVGCALATLDHDVGVISRVGDDDAAETIVGSLHDHDVDTSGVRQGDGTSSYTLVLRGPDGDRMIVAGGNSVPQLRLRATDRERLRGADCVFTSAYAPDTVVTDLLDLRESGVFDALAFDLAGPLEELEGRGTAPETIDRLTESADLFVVGEVAARSYLGTGPRDAAERLCARGADRVAVTVGAEGAYLAADELYRVDAVEADVVDTTGAGDAFTATLIDTWVLGDYPAAAAGRLAAAAAAQNCTASGPRGGLPTREDLPEP
ncbi:carbohydrate kinase family protein [Halorhabdus sp. CBA1104]|uniref:carbohydrate kinase family protein n=1 Tax=unclassified Halorhabdus TaxID=2621901 RepID=UPI0012B21CCB|nr:MULTISPECIES: carbohydrate kinase family protein [unclassified Halorhabdus]QGN07864.1 carbohydrate kinase family protein [Halorhabdus sp. CBA1104]